MVKLLISFTLFWLSGFVQASTVLVLGDSISAAYGLEKQDHGWVARLRDQLKPKGVEVANASISGETSGGGLARIDALLKTHRPSIVILELGGNDGLRGLSPKQLEANLGDMIARSKAAGAKVLLLGMKIPPNYGRRYTELFESVYPKLAAQHGVPLVPFFLEGVGGQAHLMQTDGIHPNGEAQAVLLRLVWEKLEGMLGE
jgi:acyl-CoA thioesterase-1